MYEQVLSYGSVSMIPRISDNTFIPLDPRNRDYQTMKTDLLAGAELLDATGAKIDGVAYARTLK